MKKPNIVYYHTIGRLVNLIARIRGQKVFRHFDKFPKSPFIFVSNHTAFYDFAYIFRAAFPVRINAVMARKYSLYSSLKLFFRLHRIIGKSLFETDPVCMRQMIDTIRSNGVLAMCPEGQIPYAGESTDFGYGLGMLIKKYSLPVVTIRTVGAYFANPPWSFKGRRGPIKTDVKIHLTKDDVEKMTVAEIDKSIAEELYIDSCAECVNLEYTGKELTRGLEGVLYLCPHCFSECEIRYAHNNLKCENCGYEVKISGNGIFSQVNKELMHNNINDWWRFQESYERDKLKTPDFVYKTQVTINRIDGKGKRYPIGHGEFSLCVDSMTYCGSFLEEKNATMQYDTLNRQYIPCDRNMNFQIYTGGIYTEYVPENPRRSCQISVLAHEAHVLKKERQNQ